MLTKSLLLSLSGSVMAATNLYATHYSGTLNLLQLDGVNLKLAGSSSLSAKSPSWPTWDSVNNIVYNSDETSNPTPPTAPLAAVSWKQPGHAFELSTVQAPNSVVNTVLYGGKDKNSFIAIAHYGTGKVSTWKLPLASNSAIQTFEYKEKSIVAGRQDSSHPHQVLTDPSGDFLLVTDLGADLIRIYKIDQTSGMLTECPAGKATPGTGPRHSAFWTQKHHAHKVVLYAAAELTNTISTFDVTYDKDCLSLSLKQTVGPFKGNATSPAAGKQAYVGEIRTRGHNVYVSNRNDQSFAPSDSISTFHINRDGTIEFIDISPSHGTYPRTFDINKDGTRIAIGNQFSANVAIVERDTKTGKLGEMVADLRVGDVGDPAKFDGLSAVIFAE